LHATGATMCFYGGQSRRLSPWIRQRLSNEHPRHQHWVAGCPGGLRKVFVMLGSHLREVRAWSCRAGMCAHVHYAKSWGVALAEAPLPEKEASPRTAPTTPPAHIHMRPHAGNASGARATHCCKPSNPDASLRAGSQRPLVPQPPPTRRSRSAGAYMSRAAFLGRLQMAAGNATCCELSNPD
jgi:hypothetical protein